MNSLSILAGSLVLLLILLTPLQLSAQHQERTEVLSRISEAFSEGDVRSIIEQSSERIELSIFGNSTLYSRSQAVYVLQEFFRDHPPSSCDFEEISLTGESQFATGKLAVRGVDEPLRVYVRLRSIEEDWKLREVRIEHAR